ncbi:DUF2200 domain-containing protein [Companilactobacillus pabuli]|uniref:DUF2200 domain-containing protein n=1 Tax=Companilactobacillus pabuli TaxID=2714036 RepID=UPI0015F4EA6F|nr:DUF2200 domain-containing protein [Companilactobacillus pabuli]
MSLKCISTIFTLYIKKVERKNHTQAEVDQIITWLTGYNQDALRIVLQEKVTFEDFFNQAPNFNDQAKLITGTICGVKVEDITDPIVQKIRYLDKLIDELAHNKKMDKILRH